MVHWPLMSGLLHMVQRRRDWAGPQPDQASVRCTNVTVHRSTASVPITVLLYNDALLCGFNVPINSNRQEFFGNFLLGPTRTGELEYSVDVCSSLQEVSVTP